MVVLAAAAACGSAATPTGTATVRRGPWQSAGSPASYYLRAASQPSDGRSLVVDTVTLARGRGFVAVHSDGDGAPGPVIGVSTLLPKGTSHDVVVTLTRPVPPGTTVFPMVHVADGSGTRFTYPRGDPPAVVKGLVVVVEIKLLR